MDDELAGNRLHDFLQRGVHCPQQEICILLRHRQIQAKIILQVFCRKTELHIQSIGSKPVYAKSIDNLLRHRLISSLCKGPVYDLFQLSAGTNNAADGHITLQQTIGFNRRPVIIKRDNARRILRNLLIKNILDRHGNILQDMSVLNDVDLIKHINV